MKRFTYFKLFKHFVFNPVVTTSRNLIYGFYECAFDTRA